MEKFKCKYIDLLDKMDELANEGYFSSIDDFTELEKESDRQIIYDNWYVEIPSMGIRAHEGSCLNYMKGEEDYCPEFEMTLIFDAETGRLIFEEQDDLPTTINNYVRSRKIDISEDLECMIVVPNF